MSFEITQCRNTVQEYGEIVSLLYGVFVDGGYTEKPVAEQMFTPDELKKRGEILLAKSDATLAGMIIFSPPSIIPRQIANPDEAEIRLLAVYPKYRGKGIATSLLLACEKRATESGYFKTVLSTQKTMHDAHRIYEKHGYQRNPARDWKRGQDKIFYVYEKSLQ